MSSLSDAFLSTLRSGLSDGAQVLTDPSSADFKEKLLRWSNIDLKVPGAIALPATEEDAAYAMKVAVEAHVPVVPKSGGHSLWSTIDGSGFILDMSLQKSIEIDNASGQITVQSGVLVKEVNKAAFDAGLVLPLGTANTAGVIPMVLGGGLTLLASKVSYGSDTIVRARMVTAKGEVIEVSKTSNPELLYALRGAGQYFGLVTEVTLQAQPLSVLGSSDATVWSGSMIFPASRASEVAAVVAPLLNDPSTPTCGLILIGAIPDISIIVSPYYFGPPAEAEALWAPVVALGPIASSSSSVPWLNVNDGIDFYDGKGDFKRFAGTGAHVFKPEALPTLVGRYEELLTNAPDAANTAYAIEFNSYLNPSPPAKIEESAWGHRDIKVWMELLSWYTDADSYDEVFQTEQEALNDYRKVNPEVPPAVYQNWSRNVPIEWRYRGAGRLEKLRELKKVWDPNGVYTRELL